MPSEIEKSPDENKTQSLFLNKCLPNIVARSRFVIKKKFSSFRARFRVLKARLLAREQRLFDNKNYLFAVRDCVSKSNNDSLVYLVISLVWAFLGMSSKMLLEIA
jgi:DNA gyrase/topoisomerase IV subunit B